jgi:hypothetical protein
VFRSPVKEFDLREGFIEAYGKKWDLSAGQKIILWGRADFTNAASKLSPHNYLLRSPDREEIDMGNFLGEFNYYLTEKISLQAVVIPVYRASILNIEQVALPAYVTYNQINSFVNSKTFSYGLKADLHLTEVDIGLLWFDGFDPMQGIAITAFSIDTGTGIPQPRIELSEMPYKTRMAGLDFETSTGAFGIRGEFTLSAPVKDYRTYEYVPLPAFDAVLGGDWSSGNWRITGEYHGRFNYNFIPPGIKPLIGSEPDYSVISQMMAVPGFDFRNLVFMQTGAFNRLFNYQLKRIYHTGALRIETDLGYGKITPSVFTSYNFTTREIYVIPEIRYKPSDGITVTAGADLYSGPGGSLYDIIKDFMNNIYMAVRFDF